VDSLLIAARTGHKDHKMTASAYAHIMPASLQALRKLTEEMLKNGMKD
jgi:hypothetical protein